MSAPSHRPAIVQSLLDTDLYKFTMLQVVLHQFPQAHGVYEFRCRNNDQTAYPLADIKDNFLMVASAVARAGYCGFCAARL